MVPIPNLNVNQTTVFNPDTRVNFAPVFGGKLPSDSLGSKFINKKINLPLIGAYLLIAFLIFRKI